MTPTTHRPPMRPETQAACRAYLNAVYLAEDQAHIEATRREYRRLAEIDPCCILGDAAEQDGWAERAVELAAAAKTDAERDRQTKWAATCMAEAQRMRARAEAIMADEYPWPVEEAA